jgi:hypothetical protein
VGFSSGPTIDVGHRRDGGGMPMHNSQHSYVAELEELNYDHFQGDKENLPPDDNLHMDFPSDQQQHSHEPYGSEYGAGQYGSAQQEGPRSSLTTTRCVSITSVCLLLVRMMPYLTNALLVVACQPSLQARNQEYCLCTGSRSNERMDQEGVAEYPGMLELGCPLL